MQEIQLAQVAMDNWSTNPASAISQAQYHLSAARATLDNVRPVAEFTTSYGVEIAFLQQPLAWWQFVDATTELGQTMLNVATLTQPALSTGDRQQLLDTLPRLTPHLQMADAAWQRAYLARQQLTVTWLPTEWTTAAENGLAQWDAMAPLLAETLPQTHQLTDILPSVLGHPDPVTYLVIIQSSDNLRATGGFLTGFGLVRVENGAVSTVDIRDVVESELRAEWSPETGFLSERILPPEPVQRYLGLGHWVLRDGNWWADFPATARQVTEFWQLIDSRPVDGVIGMTDQGIASLLEVTGPITLSDGQTITAQNMKIVAGERIYQRVTPRRNQQTLFFQEMAYQIAAALERLPASRWLALAQILHQAQQRNDIMLASFEPKLAEQLHATGLDGGLRGEQDDYFYLVEDNLSDNKLNAFMPQTMHYEVQLTTTGRPNLATLTINKANNYVSGTELVGFPEEGYTSGGRWDPQTQRWDKWEGYHGAYLRLFPSPESQLIAATGFDDKIDVVTETNRLIFGGYIGLWAGTTRHLQFQWQPTYQPTVPGQYRLYVQRQPGALENPLTVTVHLPAGYRAVAVTPPPASTSELTIIWQTILDQDKSFVLQLTPP